MAYGNQPRKEFDNTNRGTLEAEKEKKDENDRDFRGAINVDGRDYWISGWKRSGKYGPFISLSVKPKQEQRRQTYKRQTEEDNRVSDPFEDF